MFDLNLNILRERDCEIYNDIVSVEQMIVDYLDYASDKEYLFKTTKQLNEYAFGLENLITLYNHKVRFDDSSTLNMLTGLNVDNISIEGIIDGIKTFIQKIIAFIKKCFGITSKQDTKKKQAIKNIEAAPVVQGTGPDASEDKNDTKTEETKANEPVKKSEPKKEEPNKPEEKQIQKSANNDQKPQTANDTKKSNKPAPAPVVKPIYTNNKYTFKAPKYFEEHSSLAWNNEVEQVVKNFKSELDAIANIDVNKINTTALETLEFNSEKIQELYKLSSYTMEGKFVKQYAAMLNKCYDEINVNQYLLTYNKKIKEVESRLGEKAAPQTANKLNKALKGLSDAVSAVTKYRSVMFNCIMDINKIVMTMPSK